MTETLYRRPLPDGSIAFASAEGRAVFAEALAAGGLAGYFALAEQYQTQSDPAFCGLGSLVVALNALAIDPGRLWKGPWRWFSEELLDCCVALDQVRAQGVDLDTLACLARCNGADARAVRPDDGEAGDEVVRAAIAAAGRSEGDVIIAAYDRAALGQTGSGHFSPVGGYHAGRDLVLVLDVARFKYPPHWVPLPRLAAAMRTIDPTTGRRRGWLALRRRERAQGVGLSLSCAGCLWPEVGRRLRAALSTPWPADTSLATIAASLASISEHCVACAPQTPDHAAAVERVLGELRATEAHAVARAAAGDAAGADAIAALLLLYARIAPSPSDALSRLTAEAARSPALAAELDRLAAQSEALRTLTA